jgi:hypothetical protein
MPLKNGKITPRERVFVKAMAVTDDSTYAATKAGYAHPQQNAFKLLQRPAVVDAVMEEQLALLHNEILPLAVRAHRRLLTDEHTPAGALVQAIRLAYDRTLGADEPGRASKEPHEMDATELAAAIANLERIKADRAKPVIEGKAIDGGGVFD